MIEACVVIFVIINYRVHRVYYEYGNGCLTASPDEVVHLSGSWLWVDEVEIQ